jgi:alkylation response protein AidB-like acyl-CoA dehydrogenase
MTTDLLETARSLAPTVEAAAPDIERLGHLTDAVGRAVLDAGLLHLLVPASLGGHEAGIVETIEVFEELARQDGSTGWSAMATAASTAFAAVYTSDAVAQELFGDGRRPVMAGQLSPRGQAVPVPGADAYTVSGSYRFGSGSDRATHLLGGCLALVDGAPALRPNGAPEILAAVVPREQVALRGNWDVMGLAGTASVDYDIASTTVDAGAVFSIFSEEPRRGGAVHRLGVMTITAAGHAGFALGVARRALDEIAALAATKTRPGEPRPADQQAFQVGFARAEAKVRAARSFVLESFAACEAAVAATGEQPDEVRQLARLATTWGTEVCAEAVTWAYHESGSDGLRVPGPVGRCFRDIHAATQHRVVSRPTLTDAAVTLLSHKAGRPGSGR